MTCDPLKRGFIVLSLLITSLPAVTVEAQQSRRVASEKEAAQEEEEENVAAKPAVAPPCEPFIRTELFFGTRRPDGHAVSMREWRAFLRQKVTPEFPEGLTALTAAGQFRNSSGKIIRETSILLILLYPAKTQTGSDEKIERIRGAYKRAFGQESVLRVDDPQPVCVSF